MKCKCGNDRFHGHQVSHHDVVVDGHGSWQTDEGVYFSAVPFGPFTCTVCGAEYETLDDLPCDDVGGLADE